LAGPHAASCPVESGVPRSFVSSGQRGPTQPCVQWTAGPHAASCLVDSWAPRSLMSSGQRGPTQLRGQWTAGPHAASCPVDSGAQRSLVSCGQWGHVLWGLSGRRVKLTSAEMKKTRIYTFTSPYAFITQVCTRSGPTLPTRDVEQRTDCVAIC
jgi:hypothetical protein